MEYRVIRNNNELYHYGVKGMKWGVRRKSSLPKSSTRKSLDSTKANYKQAKKDYNKAYNKAYNYSDRHAISQFTNKKKRAESDKRWDDAYDKAEKLRDSKAAYKSVKKERNQAINKAYRDVKKNSSVGEKLVYNSATRKRAAKYVVDNDMSMSDAKKRANKDARRNTAVLLSAYGAVAVGGLYLKSKR